MNFQAPWVLGVDETKAELQKQLDHFMAFEQYLKQNRHTKNPTAFTRRSGIFVVRCAILKLPRP